LDCDILSSNKEYWDSYADNWLELGRATVLPQYGVALTEDSLRLFGDVSGKKLLDICCGSGHSMQYHADRGAAELWGLDISHTQIAFADEHLKRHGYTAKLICSPMEADAGIPVDYFDCVYSVYGIGWTTDLEGTFRKIASYLKKDGIFIFSWHHPLNYCVAWSIPERRVVMEDGKLVFHRSYFDESWFRMPVDGSEITLCNRKISTYVNALAGAGFAVEQMIELPAQSIGDDSDNAQKARMLPISVCFKARKL